MTTTQRRGRPTEAAVLVAPALAGVLAFGALPLVAAGWLALHAWDILGAPRFVGLQGAADALADPRVAHAELVTLALTALAVPLQTVLGLAVALALPHAGRWRGPATAALLVPWLASPVVVGVLWRWILAPESGVPAALLGRRVDVLTEPVPAFVALVLVLVWTQVGYTALLFGAALSRIPVDVVEAARLDGATGATLVRAIVLPILRPTTVFVVVLGTIGAVTAFEIVQGLTGGGPGDATETIGVRMYRAAFEQFDVGRASVLAVLLAVIGGALALGARWAVGGRGARGERARRRTGPRRRTGGRSPGTGERGGVGRALGTAVLARAPASGAGAGAARAAAGPPLRRTPTETSPR